MPTNKSSNKLLLYPVDDKNAQKNFDNIDKEFWTLGAVARAVDSGTVELAVGDNSIPCSVKAPVGRITIYLSAASDLYDKGMSGGKWVINASVACTARFLFF